MFYHRRIFLNFMGRHSYRLEQVSKSKWPGEEVKVVNILPDDDPCDEKFMILKKANIFTQVYLVGHYYPGKPGLYNEDKKHCYPFEWIAKLLSEHINAVGVSIKGAGRGTTQHRHLELHLIACHSGSRIGNFKKKPSFAEKLFVSLLNDKKNPLSVEIHAPKMFVFPIPSAEEDYQRSPQKLVLQPSFNRDWHLRYIDSPLWRGQFSFRKGYAFYSFFSPSTTPPGNYKQIIRPDDSALLGYRVLTLKEYEEEVAQSIPPVVKSYVETCFHVDSHITKTRISYM